ncbi:WH2 domain-containing protein [Candidatus Cardinium hertigii]|uniref:WH2 domain-containing protein n=1 Tax=Candidatus Cardinium hertigii TaxID=247481 RepID=UPI003D7DB1BF
MAGKFNTYKSIHKGVPNILFTTAYLLFSAEICTSSPKDKVRKGIGNGSLAIDQVKQTNKIEAISNPEADASYTDAPSLDLVVDIDPVEDDGLLDTDTTDTDTATPSVEPSEQSVVQDKVKASVVDTTSSLKQQQKDDLNCLIDLSEASDRNMDGIGASFLTSSQGRSCLLSFNKIEDYLTQPPIVPVSVNNDHPNGMLDSNGVGDGNTHGALLPLQIDKSNGDGVNDLQSDASLHTQLRNGGEKLKEVPQVVREKSAADPRSKLLGEIRDGITLKKVEKNPEQKPLNTREHNDVLSMILERRVAVEVSESESESESDSYSSWADDESNNFSSTK